MGLFRRAKGSAQDEQARPDAPGGTTPAGEPDGTFDGAAEAAEAAGSVLAGAAVWSEQALKPKPSNTASDNG